MEKPRSNLVFDGKILQQLGAQWVVYIKAGVITVDYISDTESDEPEFFSFVLERLTARSLADMLLEFADKVEEQRKKKKAQPDYSNLSSTISPLERKITATKEAEEKLIKEPLTKAIEAKERVGMK